MKCLDGSAVQYGTNNEFTHHTPVVDCKQKTVVGKALLPVYSVSVTSKQACVAAFTVKYVSCAYECAATHNMQH